MNLTPYVKKYLKLLPMIAISLAITSCSQQKAEREATVATVEAPVAPAPAVAKIQRAWQDKQGNIHEQKSWQKAKDNLGVVLFATNNVPAFEKAWYHPASESYTPKITTTDKAKVGESIHLIVMFSGCEADTKGNCHLKGNMKIIDPTGKQLADENVDFFQNTEPKKGITTASPTRLEFGIEKQDTKGSYQFKYVITDVHANTTLNLSKNITFTK